ncbi:MAG: ACP S-malonyltransferase [Bdellovibrionales bacterium]
MMIALLYPGQGSQHTGMGKFLCDNFKLANHIFEEASDAIKVDLKKLCFDAPESELTLTQNSQPALLTVSTATSRVLNSLVPIKPIAAAGHSAGEYAAAVNAEALEFTAAVRAVRIRGEAMQEAVPAGVGGMAAIMGMTSEHVEAICDWVNKTSGAGPLEPANYNAPGQIVISGTKAAITWLQQNYAPNKVPGVSGRLKLIPLKVSAPFHCSMMKPAELRMAEVLKQMTFRDARHPIVQNVTAEPVTEAELLRQNLIKQIASPVRWNECVERLRAMGVDTFIEAGCGRVLSGLTKKIDSNVLNTFNINSKEELLAFETAFNNDSSVPRN